VILLIIRIIIIINTTSKEKKKKKNKEKKRNNNKEKKRNKMNNKGRCVVLCGEYDTRFAATFSTGGANVGLVIRAYNDNKSLRYPVDVPCMNLSVKWAEGRDLDPRDNKYYIYICI